MNLAPAYSPALLGRTRGSGLAAAFLAWRGGERIRVITPPPSSGSRARR
jgi:hypothetical protein